MAEQPLDPQALEALHAAIASGDPGRAMPALANLRQVPPVQAFPSLPAPPRPLSPVALPPAVSEAEAKRIADGPDVFGDVVRQGEIVPYEQHQRSRGGEDLRGETDFRTDRHADVLRRRRMESNHTMV